MQLVTSCTLFCCCQRFFYSNFLSDRQRLILEVLAVDASLSAKAISEKISEKISVSDRTIETDLAQLKKIGILSREGGRKEGKWIIKTD